MGGQLNTSQALRICGRNQICSLKIGYRWKTTYAGRYFQFKAVLTTDHVDQTPIVDELGATLQFERRTENSGTITSELQAGPKRFIYADADTRVAVGITAFDMEAGDYFVLDPNTVTESGFTITFKNSSTVISRDFRYMR